MKFLILGLLILLSGCGDLKQPYPAKAYFGIEPGLPERPTASADKASATQPADARLLLVHPVRVAPPYDGLAFVSRTGRSKYETDYYDNWIASPSALLTGGLSGWLDRTGFVRTSVAGSSAHPDMVLDAEVSELLIDRTDPSHPQAVVNARFFMTSEATHAGAVVFDRAYSKQVPVSPDNPDGDASAIGQAYQKILQELTAAMKQLPLVAPSSQP